mmetsp:Transcript_117923/g.375948  ORF Transcript_117923/g.375948 Transcript_117923/m.375948 type:complete len:267 (+) Transcript_117923:2705-3505(+)
MSIKKHLSMSLPLSMPRLLRVNSSAVIFFMTFTLCKSVLSMMIEYDRTKMVSEQFILTRNVSPPLSSLGPPPQSAVPASAAWISSGLFSRNTQRTVFKGSCGFTESAPPATSQTTLSCTGGCLTKYDSAKLSISLSISCDSPGSLKVLSNVLSASTRPSPLNGNKSMNALRTCPLKSWRFERYSPTTRRSKPGVCFTNSAMDSGVGGLDTKPKLCKADILLEGSELNVLAAKFKRLFCSLFRCNSVSAAHGGEGEGNAAAPSRKCR